MNHINNESTIEFNFELSLADGQIVDSNLSQSPVRFKMGDGSLLPGFESQLLTLAAGDEKKVVVPASQAFGAVNPNNKQSMKKDEFSSDIELEEGLVVSFADANQNELPGVITSWDDQWVEVDFNHPLAGKDIIFFVHIHSVA